MSEMAPETVVVAGVAGAQAGATSPGETEPEEEES